VFYSEGDGLFTNQDPMSLKLINDRIYRHKALRVNYTTYNAWRAQDSLTHVYMGISWCYLGMIHILIGMLESLVFSVPWSCKLVQNSSLKSRRRWNFCSCGGLAWITKKFADERLKNYIRLVSLKVMRAHLVLLILQTSFVLFTLSLGCTRLDKGSNGAFHRSVCS